MKKEHRIDAWSMVKGVEEREKLGTMVGHYGRIRSWKICKE